MFIKKNGSLMGMGLEPQAQFGDGFTNISVLTPQQIYLVSAPNRTNAISGASDLQLTATCPAGGAYYLLAGTNPAQFVSQWSRAATNLISDRNHNVFTVTLTNAVKAKEKEAFYLLQSP